MYVGRARNPAEVQDALKLAAEIFLVDVPTEQRLANKEMVTRRTPGFCDENVIVPASGEHGVIGTIVLVPSTLMRADFAISCSGTPACALLHVGSLPATVKLALDAPASSVLSGAPDKAASLRA